MRRAAFLLIFVALALPSAALAHGRKNHKHHKCDVACEMARGSRQAEREYQRATLIQPIKSKHHHHRWHHRHHRRHTAKTS